MIYTSLHTKHTEEEALTKWERGNDEWGTDERLISQNQSWKPVPIFNVKVDNVMIWTRDNRNESEHVSEEISLITGLKRTSSSSMLSKDVFEQSLMASVSVTALSLNNEARIKNEIQQSL